MNHRVLSTRKTGKVHDVNKARIFRVQMKILIEPQIKRSNVGLALWTDNMS